MDKCTKCGTLFQNKTYDVVFSNGILYIECDNCRTKNVIIVKQEDVTFKNINKIEFDIEYVKQEIEKLKRKKK